MITVTKEFTFDAAHKLTSGYEGACANLHGHTYKLLVTIGTDSSIGGDYSLNKFGMVIDFKELKSIWETNIAPFYDHKYLNESLSVWQTTAEIMAEDICNRFDSSIKVFHPELEVKRVDLYETPTSCATFIPNKFLNK